MIPEKQYEIPIYEKNIIDSKRKYQVENIKQLNAKLNFAINAFDEISATSNTATSKSKPSVNFIEHEKRAKKFMKSRKDCEKSRSDQLKKLNDKIEKYESKTAAA